MTPMHLIFWIAASIVGASEAGNAQVLPSAISDRYSIVKKEMAEAFDGLVPGEKGGTGLTPCNDLFQKIVGASKERIEGRLDRLAFEIHYYGSILADNNIPRAVWLDTVRNFEAQSIADISRGNAPPFVTFRTRLASQVNVYRAKYAPTLPRIYSGVTECGAGEVTVTLLADPPATKIEYIKKWNFRFCDRTPENLRRSCVWHAYGGKPISMSGQYMLRAFWKDQGPSVTPFNVDEHPGDEKGAISFTLTPNKF